MHFLEVWPGFPVPDLVLFAEQLFQGNYSTLLGNRENGFSERGATRQILNISGRRGSHRQRLPRRKWSGFYKGLVSAERHGRS